MAKQAAAAGSAPKQNIVERVQEFFIDVKAELYKVTWPTMDELKTHTSVVLVLLVALAAIVYAFDVVSQIGVVGLLNLGSK